MNKEIIEVLNEYNSLGINQQLDYDKFYLYSIITHSTAIEGSTITEIENQVLFDDGISCAKPISEQFMNLDLKKAYEQSFLFAKNHEKITIELLCKLSGILMKNTGSSYNTIGGSFSEFCDWLNEQREKIDSSDIENAYKLSFEAHFRLASIHPWSDGNGRMSRLLMNLIQYEKNLVPSIVKKENRVEYIKAISESQDNEDSSQFIDFMFFHHIQNLKQQIEEYKRSL